jgi:hypothetical protein
MIWVVSALALAAPQPATGQAFEAYGRCHHTETTEHRHDGTPLEVGRAAIATCAAHRQALLSATVDRRAPDLGRERAREDAERRIEMIDAIVPAMVLDRPVRLVPASECASGMKDGDQCLE